MKANKKPTITDLCEWLNSINEVNLYKVIDDTLYCKVNPENNKYFKVINLDYYLKIYLDQIADENDI